MKLDAFDRLAFMTKSKQSKSIMHVCYGFPKVFSHNLWNTECSLFKKFILGVFKNTQYNFFSLLKIEFV